MRHGQVIMQEAPETWQKEEAKLWYAYNDSLPFRRAVLEELQKFAIGGFPWLLMYSGAQAHLPTPATAGFGAISSCDSKAGN